MESLTSKEMNYCEIIKDVCPYIHPCSMCRLYRDYEAAKEKAARREASGKDTA